MGLPNLSLPLHSRTDAPMDLLLGEGGADVIERLVMNYASVVNGSARARLACRMIDALSNLSQDWRASDAWRLIATTLEMPGFDAMPNDDWPNELPEHRIAVRDRVMHFCNSIRSENAATAAARIALGRRTPEGNLDPDGAEEAIWFVRHGARPSVLVSAVEHNRHQTLARMLRMFNVTADDIWTDQVATLATTAAFRNREESMRVLVEYTPTLVNWSFTSAAIIGAARSGDHVDTIPMVLGLLGDDRRPSHYQARLAALEALQLRNNGAVRTMWQLDLLSVNDWSHLYEVAAATAARYVHARPTDPWTEEYKNSLLEGMAVLEEIEMPHTEVLTSSILLGLSLHPMNPNNITANGVRLIQAVLHHYRDNLTDVDVFQFPASFLGRLITPAFDGLDNVREAAIAAISMLVLNLHTVKEALDDLVDTCIYSTIDKWPAPQTFLRIVCAIVSIPYTGQLPSYDDLSDTHKAKFIVLDQLMRKARHTLDSDERDDARLVLDSYIALLPDNVPEDLDE